MQSQKLNGYYMNKIYTCDSCGTVVATVDNAAPGSCYCCGSSSLTFVRETDMRLPDVIIPFEIKREEAIRKVSEEYLDGVFIPRRFRHRQPDVIQGVYVPYYLFKVEYDTSLVIRSIISSGETAEERYYLKSAYGTLSKLTVDALNVYNDQVSVRVDPYDLSKRVEFDTDYLHGYCSGVADVSVGEAIVAAKDKANDSVDRTLQIDILGRKQIIDSRYI